MNGKTKTLALLADPCEHSKSPEMYQELFQSFNINATYVAHQINEQNLYDAIQAIRVLNYHGVNISMPNKSLVMDYIDVIDRDAQLIGAVNCIVNNNGKLTGYNTDGLGFIRNLEANHISIENKSIVVLGMGGVGKAIAIQLALNNAKKVSIFNRKDVFYQEGQNQLISVKKHTRCEIDLHDLDDTLLLQKQIKNADIVVNATSIGMLHQQSPLPKSVMIENHQIAIDVIYEPAETLFLKDAKENGATILNGQGMLYHQGLENIKLWFKP